MDEVISQHADEQMALDPTLDLMVDRPQSEIGLQAAEYRFQIGEHGVGAP